MFAGITDWLVEDFRFGLRFLCGSAACLWVVTARSVNQVKSKKCHHTLCCTSFLVCSFRSCWMGFGCLVCLDHFLLQPVLEMSYLKWSFLRLSPERLSSSTAFVARTTKAAAEWGQGSLLGWSFSCIVVVTSFSSAECYCLTCWCFDSDETRTNSESQRCCLSMSLSWWTAD